MKNKISVEEQHPLKQGLKPLFDTPSITTSVKVEEQHPLKQGLKHTDPFLSAQHNLVEEQHPLKQGLKHRPVT